MLDPVPVEKFVLAGVSLHRKVDDQFVLRLGEDRAHLRIHADLVCGTFDVGRRLEVEACAGAHEVAPAQFGAGQRYCPVVTESIALPPFPSSSLWIRVRT